MKILIRKIIYSIIIFYLFAEIVSRIFHLSTDAPRMYQNSQGNVKYFPNQEGYWEGAKHKWYINELGYPGRNLPSSYNNLVTIVGPSGISNFMNPDSCRQMEILREIKPKYNYLELSRPGLNILESFELIKEIDSLNSKNNFIYVIDKSFTKSIKKNSVTTGRQLDINTAKISFSQYKESSFKKVLYNLKFAYYLYRKNIHFFKKNSILNFFSIKNKSKKRVLNESFSQDELEKISKLVDFIIEKYRTDNVALIFNDRNNDQIYNLVKSKGIKAFRFDSGNEDWTLKNDSHWSCFGHHEAAKQVSGFLDIMNKKK